MEKKSTSTLVAEELREANEHLHEIELYARGIKAGVNIILGIIIVGIVITILPLLALGR